MASITVITPSVRPTAMWLPAQALEEQSFRDFEWIITSPDKRINTTPIGWDDTPIKFLADPPKPEGYYWSLNRAYNQAIIESSGELIVSLQDATYLDPDALDKMWFYYTHGFHNVLISGVGHKYANDSWKEITWQDPRARTDQGTFYPCTWTDIEFNFCSVPKEAFYAVGGFDEELDKYSGMDHISVQERLLDLKGWDFYLDQTNHSYSLEHGRLPKWEENNALKGAYMERKAELKRIGKWPVLEYLLK
jgi:hypothetical protein